MISETEQHRQELEALCHEYGVERLALFGSAATGGYQANSSDLDFLVEFRTPLVSGYADRYFGLLEGLQNIFKRPVDLVVESAIRNPYFREAVDRDKALLYAACGRQILVRHQIEPTTLFLGNPLVRGLIHSNSSAPG